LVLLFVGRWSTHKPPSAPLRENTSARYSQNGIQFTRCLRRRRERKLQVINASIASLLLLISCALIHYEVLSILKISLGKMTFISRRAKLLFVIFGAMFSHLLQISLFAGAYFLLRDKFGLGGFGGGFVDSFSSFLYFSAETYTSLGFGDICPVGAIRMLTGLEALNGLVMISWTASFTYLEMTKYWSDARNRN
jgi:hypothetical protein